jgi:hypothetical protein
LYIPKLDDPVRRSHHDPEIVDTGPTGPKRVGYLARPALSVDRLARADSSSSQTAPMFLAEAEDAVDFEFMEAPAL